MVKPRGISLVEKAVFTLLYPAEFFPPLRSDFPPQRVDVSERVIIPAISTFPHEKRKFKNKSSCRNWILYLKTQAKNVEKSSYSAFLKQPKKKKKKRIKIAISTWSPQTR